MTNEDLHNQIEFEKKWLLDAGLNIYNLDIAFDAIISAVKETALESSIPIPPNATNGDVIKAVFPRIKHSFTDKDSKVYILEPNDILTPILTAFDSWWSAPYREEDAE